MRIVVWGSYNFGNFGDDLMAVMIGCALKAKGYKPVVYRLSPEIAREYSIETSFDLSDCIVKSDACVVGGGALLSNYSLDSRINCDHESSILELCSALESRNVPLCLVSVGGSGLAGELFTPATLRLLRYDHLVSVSCRLETDVARLSKIGIRALCFPDIVMLAGRELQYTPAPLRDWVGLHLPDILPMRVLSVIVRIRLRSTGGRLVVRHFGTYLKCHWPNLHANGIKREIASTRAGGDASVYTGVRETLEALSRCRVLVSYKLHLGVCAMSVGTPFISYGGKGKTTQFLEQVKCRRMIFGRADLVRLFRTLSDSQTLEVPLVYSAQASEAEGHLKVLFDGLQRNLRK